MRIEAGVVIVGAGIGGAVLALALGRRGHRVVILERDAAPRRVVRPEILWHPTLRLLEEFDLESRIRDEASVLLREIDVGGLMTVRAADFAAAKVQAFSTDPLLTRNLITSAAQATGCVEIYRGVDVTELLRTGQRIHGVAGRRSNERFEVCADLVVGDDGVQSFIRSSLNIAIKLQVFPIDFITAGVGWPAQIPAGCARAFLNLKDFRTGIPAAALIPWPGQQGVLLIPLSPPRAESVLGTSAAEFWGTLKKTIPFAQELQQCVQFPRDFVRVSRPFGHAATYVADGVALIGDAAHPMTPAGGQGANASIWDAMSLSRTADNAIRKGDTSREKLAPYELQRRAINGRSVDISRIAFRAFRLGSRIPVQKIAPLALRTFEWSVFPKRAFLRSFATTFVDRSETSLTQ